MNTEVESGTVEPTVPANGAAPASAGTDQRDSANEANESSKAATGEPQSP